MSLINPFGVSDDDDSDSVVNFSADSFSETETVETLPPSVQSSQPQIDTPTDKRYNLVDLYWLINPKFFSKQKLDDDEGHMIVVSFNSVWANLKISLHEVNAKTFNTTSVFKHETKLITTVNIYSETAQQILQLVNTKNKQSVDVYNFERVFTSSTSSNWKPSKSVFKVDSTTGQISILIETEKKKYFYVFSNWQVVSFINSLKFLCDGKAWQSVLLTSK